MQHARKYLPWLLFANLWVATANAAPVPSLYAAVVPEADPQRSAQLAMREVLVRLTGSRAAAEDPAFAALIEDAKRYVQLERNTTHGATQVIFDATSLQAAIATAGGKVWDPDRPLVWVVLPVAAGAAADDLRAQLNAAAQTRGLPIAVVSNDTAGAGPEAAAGGATAMLAAARRAGAAAALVAEASPVDPQVLQWTLQAPNADGHWSGSAAAAIDGATNALVRAARELQDAPATELDCRVAGVVDLPSFASVLDSIGSAPGVSDLMIRAVDADQLTLHFKSRGSTAVLSRALAGDRLHPTGTGSDGVLQLRYQSGL
jgi:hypothetical protein